MTRRTFSNVCNVSITLPLERGTLTVERIDLPHIDRVQVRVHDCNGGAVNRRMELTHDEACAVYDALSLMFESNEES